MYVLGNVTQADMFTFSIKICNDEKVQHTYYMVIVLFNLNLPDYRFHESIVRYLILFHFCNFRNKSSNTQEKC